MNRKHIFFWFFLRPLVVIFLKIKFGYKYEKAKELPGNYIVLSNHVTDYDPLFAAASFKRQMYYVASEHISRWKHAYKLLHFAFAPIMRYKGSVAASTVMDVLRKVRAGANVCIFAEGARSWDGRTGPILPSTAKMVKRAGCGLVTYKITGGYFVSPNWSESGTRRGYVRGAPVKVYTAQQLADMSVDEIYAAITRDLYEDAYERQLLSPERYRGKNLAEKLENLIFVCPGCGKTDTMRSGGDTVSCRECGASFGYDEYGMLHGGEFRTVPELYEWQRAKVDEHVAAGVEYTAAEGTLAAVTKHTETPVDCGSIELSCRGLRCGGTEIPLESISNMAMHGRHALVFTAGSEYYELKPAQEFNTLKFMLFFESWNKIKR